MKSIKMIYSAILIALIGFTMPVAATDTHGGHGGKEGMHHPEAVEGFTHQETVEGIRAEFQVMSLASMNMKDPDGATHHVMVTFSDEQNRQTIAEAIGKVKIIAPDGREQTQTLKNYSGTYAANFTIDQPGNYGVICLFKANGQKRVVKFWYPHNES